MKTKIANLILENSVAHEVDDQFVDFNKVNSDDSIAFVFGQRDAKAGRKLPQKHSKEYKELASEYIRGFHSRAQ